MTNWTLLSSPHQCISKRKKGPRVATRIVQIQSERTLEVFVRNAGSPAVVVHFSSEVSTTKEQVLILPKQNEMQLKATFVVNGYVIVG